MTGNNKEDDILVPYIAKNGRPFHRLPESQRRWYTRGNLSENEVMELGDYFEQIEQRVVHYQGERVRLRGEASRLLTFSEDTPVEERQRRLDEVDTMREQYVAALDSITTLKSTVVTITPGEPLVLEPLV